MSDLGGCHLEAGVKSGLGSAVRIYSGKETEAQLWRKNHQVQRRETSQPKRACRQRMKGNHVEEVWVMTEKRPLGSKRLMYIRCGGWKSTAFGRHTGSVNWTGLSPPSLNFLMSNRGGHLPCQLHLPFCEDQIDKSESTRHYT